MNAPVHFDKALATDSSPRYRCRPPTVLLVRDAPAEPETAGDWKLVHERIVALGAERATREHELCRWLRAASRLAVHARLGFASLGEYAERVLGLRARQLEERLRVARALEVLPVLDRALSRGELCWSAVRELSRVATGETEGAWRRWAEGRRIREIEQTVAARHPGERPESRPDPALVRHRLRFEVRAETMALFRDLEARVRAELGEAAAGEVDDDRVLYEIARRALGGPGDEGRASYQVAVTRCPECLRASIEGGGQSHEVDAVVSEMVACDCQDVGVVDRFGRFVGSPQVASRDPRELASTDGGDVNSPHVDAERASAEVVADEATECPHLDAGRASAAVAAEETTECPRVRAPFDVAPPARPRATQTIPPATRRAVMRRDRGRCAVPGCRNHRFLDVHHVVPRAEGGEHDPELMLIACGAHHRAIHEGSLVIQGTASRGFTFRHADGTPYGERPCPDALEVTKQVLGALEQLGFTAGRARALVDEVRKRGAAVGGQGAEALLRAALMLA